MKGITSFELDQLEKMMKALDLDHSEQIEDDIIQKPKRDYLMAWNFGYILGDFESDSKSV